MNSRIVRHHKLTYFQVRGDKPLDDYDVEPAAIEARVFLVNANLTKSVFAAERATCLVERKDAR